MMQTGQVDPACTRSRGRCVAASALKIPRRRLLPHALSLSCLSFLPSPSIHHHHHHQQLHHRRLIAHSIHFARFSESHILNTTTSTLTSFIMTGGKSGGKASGGKSAQS